MLRIVRYAGKGSFDIVGDTEIDKGYALALPQAEQLVMSMIRLLRHWMAHFDVFRRLILKGRFASYYQTP